MSTAIARGSRVVHETLGPGQVNRPERGGRWLWVTFERSPGMPFRVQRSQLVEEGRDLIDKRSDRQPRAPSDAGQTGADARTGRDTGRNKPVADPRTASDAGQIDAEPSAPAGQNPTELRVRYRALVLLEALRLGVVPRGAARHYTVGRKQEIEDLLSVTDPPDPRRPNRGGKLRVVVGDYGTGKTHLLECLREEVLAQGFAVAVATLDGRETTAAHPRRIYRMLMHSLTLPGDTEPGGLSALFDALLLRGYAPRSWRSKGAHRYLDPALHYYAALVDDPGLRDLLLDWIEGQPGELSVTLNRLLRAVGPGPRLLALPDYRTFAATYAYVLGGVAAFCREAGASGLCLLIDEAEFYAALRGEERVFADTVFGALALACLSDDEALRGEQEVPRGGQAVHRSLPLRFLPDQPLACIFFLTPDPVGLAALGNWVELSRHTVDLGPLMAEHYAELYERVVAIYRRAHPEFVMPKKVERPMGELLHAAVSCGALGNPRAALKLVVEFLDVCRLVPHRLKQLMADLGELFARGG